MNHLHASLSCLSLVAMTLWAGGPALAHDDDDDDNRAQTRLSGYQEVPALSTTGSGSFEAKIGPASFDYVISYRNLSSAATQSHIHFGQKGVNGGISVFLCSNLGNGPVGTQACPATSGTVRGTVTAASVIGPTGQGITSGEFNELLKAMRSGITYANVHTVNYPGGEVRGQIRISD